MRCAKTLFLEFGVFCCPYKSPEGLVLGLRLEVIFGGCALCGIGEDGFGCGRRLTELGLPFEFGSGEGFGTRVTDLRGVVGVSHFFVDDFGVLAHPAPEIVERGFH